MIVGHRRRYPPRMTHDHGSPRRVVGRRRRKGQVSEIYRLASPGLKGPGRRRSQTERRIDFMRITVDLPADLHVQVVAMARDTHRTLSETVAFLMRRGLGEGQASELTHSS